jgi:hypothetical protein
MKYVAGRQRAVKMNEVRGRFISALRGYTLTGAEFRIVIALNDLYSPELFKAWPSQAYLCEVLADVTTGRPMPVRTLRYGLRGLEKKGIIQTKEVRLSHNHSKLEYHLLYDKVIGCDAGYRNSRQRGSVKGIQMLIQAPATLCRLTGNSLPPYRQPLAGLPAEDCRLSSLGSTLGSTLGSPIEDSLEDSLNLKEERKGTPEEVETRAERSLREFTERQAARKKGAA